MVFSDLARVFEEIGARIQFEVFAVQAQIERRKAELPHLGCSRAIRPSADHPFEELFRNLFTGLMMRREEIERLALPTEVLHNLTWELDEIPSDIGAREAPDFDV